MSKWPPKKPDRVKVYRNIRTGKWSVLDIKTRRVVNRCSNLVLADCDLEVYESSRKRALREKRRNIHAFVVGTPIKTNCRKGPRISYNPFKAALFMVGTQSIKSARRVVLTPLGAFVGRT